MWVLYLLIPGKDFLLFCGLSLHSVIVSLDVQKVFDLIQSICHFLLFFLGQLVSYSESNYLCPYLVEFFLFFCSNFKVLGLTLRSLIHLELIFVQHQRRGPTFSLLKRLFSCLLKKLSFQQCMFLASLSKIRWLQLCGFISGCFVALVFVFVLCQYHAVFVTKAL
jgi:hypothetical protein